MGEVQFHCPHCAGLFQLDQSQTGQEVACPTCGGVTFVPAAAPQPVATAGGYTAPTDLGCPICSGVFQVTADLAGQHVACPHCQATVEVPMQLGGPPPPARPGLPGAQSFPRPPAPGLPNISTRPAIRPPAGFVPPTPASQKPNFPAPPSPLPEIQTGGPAVRPPATPFQPPVPETASTPPIVPATPSSNHPPLNHPATPENRTAAPEIQPPAPAIDDLLPPATNDASPVSAPEEPLSSADDLLPPTASESHSEAGSMASNKDGPAALVPTADGGYVELHAPKKTVRQRGRKIELRQLSPEEKERRRLIKNIVMGGFCLMILLVALLILNYMTGQGL